ncbi:MAG TPA: cyclic nucleotide-binding domain-containing protein [Acidimicrobiales bacterium]|nr:cyclic nucleotide-binding domain-containing protein [Acidimicrobiales bacterium]
MRRHAVTDPLTHLPLLAACDDRGIEAVRRASDEICVRQGQIVHPASIGLHWAYVVVAGHLQVGDGDGARVVGPGEVFGVTEILDGVTHAGEIRALSAASVLVVGQRELFWLMDTVPGFAAGVLGDLPAIDLRERVSPRRESGRRGPGWDRRSSLVATRAASRA